MPKIHAPEYEYGIMNDDTDEIEDIYRTLSDAKKWASLSANAGDVVYKIYKMECIQRINPSFEDEE